MVVVELGNVVQHATEVGECGGVQLDGVLRDDPGGIFTSVGLVACVVVLVDRSKSNGRCRIIVLSKLDYDQSKVYGGLVG